MALDAFTQLYYNTLVELQDMREEVEVEEVKRKEFEYKLDDLQNHLAEAEKRLLVSSLRAYFKSLHVSMHKLFLLERIQTPKFWKA